MIMAASAILPWTPSAFPGELLGNWLSRLVALNSFSNIAALKKALSLPASVKGLVADQVNGGGYIEELCLILKLDPSELISKHTTLNYRRAFMPSDGSLGRIPLIGTPLLRICPACMRSDFEKPGIPYFHREHQLRSKACATHGIFLLERCPACTRPICLNEGRTLLPLTCTCGHSLSDDGNDMAAGMFWHRDLGRGCPRPKGR